MCLKRALYFLILVFIVDSARVRHHSTGKQALKFLKGLGVHNKRITSANGGLWPNVFNLATKALISVNATCGEGGREEFCRMSEGSRGRCGICDNFSPDPGKRHPINYAIDDGTNRWWQSPALYYGTQYEHVTITLDLKQIYQVAYVILKAANSPRPGAWILERSIDGENYDAWQYFATSDKDCLDRYGIPARKGKPHYFTDSEVICTSSYSKLMPMENGEIHTFLIHGRPGANETSPELLQFTKARYVRLSLQGLRGRVEPLPAWLSQDIARDKRLYYSIRDINVGGQCVCNGHASSCRHNVASGHPECECAHHTFGPNCEKCNPLFNQRQWGPATSRDSKICLPCNCHGHAKSCHYDEDVDRSGLSLDINGYYQGGGVCDNCTAHTSGINCEKCITGYYRPIGTKPDADVPCVKCDCEAPGSTGHCVFDGTYLKCACRPGFKGMRCEECDDGFRGYPNCEACPCDPRGVLTSDCEGDCICKANVEGKFCNRCKTGYLSLQAENPEGCSACYCSGATTVCESARLPPLTFSTGDGWLISDISVTEIEEPALDEHNLISVGNYEIPGIEAYYWLAPSLYLGNKLETYGSELIFKAHWVVMRGDTSGKPTTGPNVIIVGHNGMRIASGDDLYSGTNATFKIKLAEYDGSWYHVPDDVKDIITRLRRTEYKGEPVTRSQFLSVLTNIKYILLRAKYHTDQIEGSLEEAVMYSGNAKEKFSAVEQCSCPSGYTGLSCESCQYGYARILNNTSSHQMLDFCVKCECNGHSNTCNPDTGECYCEHNTAGESCERCAAGYYGNPLIGSSADCRKCACPLEEEENNFSPSCQLDSLSLSNDDDEPGYVCTQCPKGYTGDHCEICDDGYFGIPSKIGGNCALCNCGGGPCDRITGQCLGCRGNTEGWRCERCKPGYFGDPVIGCEACLCDPVGSIKSDCNNVTGECECKGHFIGRTCNKCEVGYGNVTAHCTPCTCNPIGSKSDICDPHSGLCDCHPGVEGFHCDACQHLHYGFSETGCQSCKCNPRGSELSTCDIVTGQCRCRPYYSGRSCDKCEDQYWDSPDGCMSCDCDSIGSISVNCDQRIGNCFCKLGVAGTKCDRCKTGYYGFSEKGCRECEVCNKSGHICDPDTGRCICPPHSHGGSCNVCNVNSWGHEPDKGCKLCGCSETGSIKMQCNSLTGECTCQKGYTGTKCEKCEHGYYGYPKCRRCSCNVAGTDRIKGKCDSSGICQCNNDGTCPCKSNVSGKRCLHCREGTFDLDTENPDGCTKCFCFGRSTVCTGSSFTWGKIRTQNRTLEIDFIVKNVKPPIKSNDIDVSDFEEIEGTVGNVKKSHDHFDIPLYWKLPIAFDGDQILSYGGYIRFLIGTTIDPSRRLNDVFNRYPLVQIEGNGFKLVYDYAAPHLNNRYEIRLHESLWTRINTHNSTVTRDLLMLTLQNVTGVYIKATDSSTFKKVDLADVSLDSAVKVAGNPPPVAKGVEKCHCPKEYNGTSCQNPSSGHFRQKLSNVPFEDGLTTFDGIIGKSEKCQCNNRSKICEIETGYCLNCEESTAGKSCEHCAEGYYGDPMDKKEKCLPCRCPSTTQNFAKNCQPVPRSNQFICNCKIGYEGATCQKCSSGYYRVEEGECIPCNCNVHGRLSEECDERGYCDCKPGITGRTCSQCELSRHILENNNCIPCDNCTQMLLDDIENMTNELMKNTDHLQGGAILPPWESLNSIEDRYAKLSDEVDNHIETREKLKLKLKEEDITSFENDVAELKRDLNQKQIDVDATLETYDTNMQKAESIANDLDKTKSQLDGLINSLNDFGKSHINTKEALKKGDAVLKNMTQLYKKINGLQSANDAYNNCTRLKQTAEEIMTKLKLTDPKLVAQNVRRLNERLTELQNILDNITKSNKLTTEKNTHNTILFSNLSNQLQFIEKKHGEIKTDLDENRALIEKTNELLENIEDNYYKFDLIRNEIDGLTEQIHTREAVLDESIDLLDFYKEKIENHANDLDRNVSDYISQFHISNKEINAINASRRYDEIMKILQSANVTIREAEDEFMDISVSSLIPRVGDSLSDRASISMADSDRLIRRVDNIDTQISGFSDRLRKRYSLIEDAKAQNWKNGITNNGQSEHINQLLANGKSKSGGFPNIELIIREAVRTSESMRDVYKKAADINISMQYGVVKKFLNLTTEKNINNLQADIRLTKEILNDISKSGLKAKRDDVIKMNREFGKFKTSRTALEDKLDNLRASIKKAQQIASYIRVPISGPNCSRSYKIDTLEPSTLMDITVDFMNEKNEGDLLYLSNDYQFIHLRIEDSKLIFAYNISGDDAKVISIDGIRINADVSAIITRTNKDITLSVGSIKKTRPEGNTLFNVTSQHLLYIGRNKQANTGLPGCVKDIIFNEHRIGLWEFVDTTKHCGGCNRNNAIQGNVKYKFNGEGYIVDTQTQKNMNVAQFNMQMKLRTFDENALLFLAYQEDTFMSINIIDGYISYEMHYNNTDIQPIILKSSETFNNGKEVSIDCTKTYSKKNGDVLRLKINNNDDTVQTVTRKATGQDILKIKKATFYVGGVPPDFKMKEFRGRSILGLVHEINFAGISLSQQDKQFYGVDFYGEKEVSYRQILFEGVGFVKLNYDINKKLKSFSFIIRTEAENCFILSVGEEKMVFYLENGAIQYSGFERSAELIVNDDQYHLIELKMDEFQTKLILDQKFERKIEINTETTLNTEIFTLGGNGSGKDFNGTIKDITINDQILYINSETYVASKGAKIGRSKPQNVILPDIKTDSVNTNVMDHMKDMQQVDGCDHINYTLERHALKFGDTSNTFVAYALKDNFWKSNYSIAFEFRTFYPNSILFFAQGNKQHFIMLEIKDGMVELVIKAKKRKKCSTDAMVDDGNWHNVSVQHNSNKKKNRGKISIFIDGKVSNCAIRHNKVAATLYFGDVPKAYPIIREQEPFRGCMRSIKINTNMQQMMDYKNHKIGQCFSNIERGSYFRGDSYAVYKNNFILSNSLEVSFDFRTSEQNGILLSVSHLNNHPALSLELQNGAVVMSIDMGNSVVNNVTNKLATICNQEWHHVDASFSTELTVIVDSIITTWVLSESGFEHIEEPLYIGGLPDSAPGGTLKIRENFKGCLRNLKINKEQVDWIKMDELNNVSLNSCPVT